MPKVFEKNHKIKVIEYGSHTETSPLNDIKAVIAKFLISFVNSEQKLTSKP